MGLSLKLTVPDLTGLVSGLGKVDEEVLKGWSKDADTLLAIEIANVSARTRDRAFDTGALLSSVTGQAYSDAKNGTLIAVWFNNAQQYAEWGRYYAPYQEGPPSPGGLSTYTNPPRHMLWDSQTEDTEQITTWAVDAGQSATDGWAGLFADLGAGE